MEVFQIINNKNKRANVIIFNPDGKFIAIAHGSKFSVYNLQGKCEITIDHQGGRIYSLAFSLDGDKILSGAFDGTMKLWNKWGKCIQIMKHAHSVYHVAFSPDDTALIAVLLNNIIHVWNRDGVNLKTIQCKYPYNRVIINSDCTQYIIISDVIGTAELWNLDGECLQTINHGKVIFAFTFSSDCKTIATGSFDGVVKLWNVEASTDKSNLSDLKTRHIIDKKYSHTINTNFSVYSIAFSHDGLTLAIGSRHYGIKIWDRGGKCLNQLNGNENIRSVVFSSNGFCMASISQAGIVKLWRTPEFVRWQKITFLLGLGDETNVLGRATKEWLYDRNVIREILKYL